MKCCICDKEITAPWTGRKPKYCSGACRKHAQRIRTKIGAKPESPCPRRKRVTPQQSPKPRDEQPLVDDTGDGFEYAGRDIPSNRLYDPANRHWDAAAMEREMDEDLEVTLRRSKNKLQRVIDDPDTPPGAISSLTKVLIEVSEKLEAVKKDKPAGLDLLAGTPAASTKQESEAQHGAQII